ncbi:U32 family peptidase C-terminal domain-containing protein [Ruminococcus sp. HUN007]|uniref:U32 family peptidase C-terminal domain-containing protein n=1 Tax=Ruminococcus sp. HUN007 TaxID=1514668 RepID=UPI000AE98F4B|nr:U32 family peptidase C-terminal domain-containing protein [Ruminococcus sp. HUN007]
MRRAGYIREYDVVAVVDECRDGRLYATQRNKFLAGDTLEVFSPGKEPQIIKADVIYNEKR